MLERVNETKAAGRQATSRRYPLAASGCAVDREEPQSRDLALREQHPVGRVACCRLRFDRGEGMTLVDREEFYAQSGKKLGQGDELVRQLQFAQPGFDCHLPEARCAQMMLIAAIPQEGRERRR
jgi:hypothetical protein